MICLPMFASLPHTPETAPFPALPSPLFPRVSPPLRPTRRALPSPVVQQDVGQVWSALRVCDGEPGGRHVWCSGRRPLGPSGHAVHGGHVVLPGQQPREGTGALRGEHARSRRLKKARQHHGVNMRGNQMNLKAFETMSCYQATQL